MPPRWRSSRWRYSAAGNGLRDLAAAAAIFRRAVEIAEQHEHGAWGIRALHELATIDMLRDGSTGSLSEVRELAHRAGVVTTTALIELQLANLWSLGTDLDKALAAARQCQRTAAQVKLKRFAAKAISIEANIAAIRGDRKETERIARRAEALLPGDVGRARRHARFRPGAGGAVPRRPAAGDARERGRHGPGRGIRERPLSAPAVTTPRCSRRSRPRAGP